MSHAVDLLRAEQAGLPLGASHPDPPLACFPLRSDWEMATSWAPATEPYPAPLATFTDQAPPAPVAGLRKTLSVFGWSSEVTYAHGCMPHATHGRPGEPQESWAVRLVRGAQRAVAVHRGGTWDIFWVWSATEFFGACDTLGAFLDRLAGRMVIYPSRKEWDALLAKYPLKADWRKWQRENPGAFPLKEEWWNNHR